MKKQLVIILLLAASVLTFAQSKTSLSGVVANNWNKKPIAFTNLLLMPQEGNNASGSISLEDGSFVFENLAPGYYDLSISFMGFNPDTLKNIQLKAGEELVLDTTLLKRLKTQLEEINIVAERPMIVESAGKTTLNVNERMSGSGESALELIKYLPSATTDEEDNVILRGSPATVMIDGVETDLANALDALPVGMIDKIEVITNPSAKYSSQSGAGIINIILKGEKKKGANGKVYMGAGTPERMQCGGNMILMHKKWTSFSNVDFSHYKDEKESYSERVFKGLGAPSVLYNSGKNQLVYDKWNIRQGLKYQLDPSSSLRLDGGYRRDRTSSDNRVVAKKIESDTTLKSHNQSLTESIQEKDFWNASLDYRKTFADESDLAVIVRYEHQNKRTPIEKLINYYDVSDASLKDNYQSQTRCNPELIKSWRLKMDYEKDFSTDLRLESGVLLLQRHSDAENDFVKIKYTYVDSSAFYNQAIDSSQVYSFDVSELTPSLYGVLYYEYKDWEISGGLRYELLNLDVHSSTNDSSIQNTYHNVLPSLHAMRKFTDRFSAGISASYRTKMPKYNQLSPVAVYNGLYNKNIGNPNLRPEKITNLEVNARRVFENHTVNSALFYKHFSDMINRQQSYEIEDGYDVLVRQYQNIGTVDQWGMDLNISSIMPFGIKAKTNVLMMGQDINSEYQGEAIHIKDWTWSAKITANQQVWKDLRWQLTAGYFADSKNLNGINFAYFYSNLGLSKPVLNKKGNLSLQINDLLNTVDRERLNNTSPKYDIYSRTKGVTQKVLLSFSYKFNTQLEK